jgi:hypothetical protein
MPTRDYGGRVRGVALVHVIVAVIGLGIATWIVTVTYVKDRTAHIATAKAWDIQGPPCPALTAAEWTAGHYRAEKVFDYDGVAIGRHAGNASCSDVHTDGGAGLGVKKVCQFTSPAVLTVISKKGAFYFVPGIGQLASLIIEKDAPTCVMASHYTLRSPD